MTGLHRIATLLMTAGATALCAGTASAAPCPVSGATPITIGTVSGVEPGSAHTYSFALGVGEGVIVDLATLTPKPAPATSSDDDEDGDSSEKPVTVTHTLRLCDGKGRVLAPLAGEVFEKGGSVSATPEGERLRYLATSAGTYLLTTDASNEPRELLVRRRAGGVASAPIVSATLGVDQKGTTSKAQPMVYSFDAPAGQWVMIKSTSEKDTLLRLAGPDRSGGYSVIAENDDSDGLNPVLRRRLPVAGTYYLQVDSLADDAGDFELSLQKSNPPAPPQPPVQLRAGAEIANKLSGEDDVRLYALPVVSGHSYRLEATAPYDIAVAVGVGNPIVGDDGDEKADSNFAEVKSQDSGTSGTEKLNFTARANGTLLVRIKCFGIGESDGGYQLKAIDLGA